MKKYSHCSVKRKGKKDGRDYTWLFWPFQKREKDSAPALNDTDFAAYENELFEVGSVELHEISKNWKELDHKLKPEYCKALSEQLDAQKQYDKEFSEADQAGKDLEPFKKQLNEMPSPAISNNWMVFWLLVLGLGELPLNSIAFQILGASKLETYIMTIIIGVMLPIAAHTFGKALRQDYHTLTDKIMMAISPLVILGLIGSISIFRESLLDVMQQHSTLKVNLSPQTAMVLFILINISVFFVAIIISYEGSHRNHEEYRTRNRRYKLALRSLRKESGEAELAAKKLWISNKNLQEKRQQRLKKFERFMEQAKIFVDNYEWLVRSYRAANMSVRKNATQPACFKLEPKSLIIPYDLLPENLDWNCEINDNNHEHKITLISNN